MTSLGVVALHHHAHVCAHPLASSRSLTSLITLKHAQSNHAGTLPLPGWFRRRAAAAAAGLLVLTTRALPTGATTRPMWGILTQPNGLSDDDRAFSSIPADYAFINSGAYFRRMAVVGSFVCTCRRVPGAVRRPSSSSS